MIWPLVFVAACATGNMPHHCDLPYLEAGACIYKDNAAYEFSDDVPLSEIFKKSYFAEIPEFKEVLESNRATFSKSKALIPGDGGFGGLVMERNPTEGRSMRLIFPRLEGSIKVEVIRAEGGWKATSIKASDEQITF